MMSKIKNKLNKRHIRKLWILDALLNCEPWSQKDIKKLWYLMSVFDLYSKKWDAIRGINSGNIDKEVKKKLLKKYKKSVSEDPSLVNVSKNIEDKVKEDLEKYAVKLTFKKIEKTKKTFDNIDSQCKSDISKIMNELKNLKIIDEKIIKKKLVIKHARPVESVYFLPENYKVLYLILEEINNVPTKQAKFKELILDNLMNSEYVNRLVNEELVETIESELDLSLDENDKKLILFFLKRYPSVLYYTLEKINHTSDLTNEDIPLILSLDPVKHTNGFMMDAKILAYEDIDKYGKDFGVDYEVRVTIRNNDGEITTHTNSHRIRDPEEDKLLAEIGRAQFRGLIGNIPDEKEDNNEEPIKNEEELITVPDYINDLKARKKLLDSHEKWGKIMNKRQKHWIEYVKNEIKDKSILIKDDGKEIDFLYLYVPSEDVAPY